MSNWKVDLWNAVNRYVAVCGGDSAKHVYGNTTRQKAVVEVEQVVEREIGILKDEMEKRTAKLVHKINEQGRALSYGQDLNTLLREIERRASLSENDSDFAFWVRTKISNRCSS